MAREKNQMFFCLDQYPSQQRVAKVECKIKSLLSDCFVVKSYWGIKKYV